MLPQTRYLVLILGLSACLSGCRPTTMECEHRGHFVRTEYYNRHGARDSTDKDGGMVYKPLRRETRVRFPDYTVVLHDIHAYDRYNDGIFFYEYDTTRAIYNDVERENYDGYNPDFKETIIALQDTLFLSEQLFDERINNTRIEIVPQDKHDRFHLTMRYTSTLNEVFDSRGRTALEARRFVDRRMTIHEKTKIIPLPDSARYFFRASPHTSDMQEITVRDGEIVPVKPRNTKQQLSEELRYWQHDLRRIKKRHELRDTLVVIPREYDIYATLTKSKRLFTYGFDAFVFCISRTRFGILQDRKYLVVSIAYGC